MKTANLFPALVLTALAAAPSSAVERAEMLRRDFTLAPGPGRVVTIDNVFGSVAVRAGAGDRVTVEIRRHVEARRAAELDASFAEVTLEVEESAGRLVLVQEGPFRCERRSKWRDADPPHDGSPRRYRHASDCDWDPDYDVDWQWTVTVPADVRLELGNVNGGNVSVDGVRGDLAVSNVNGGIRLAGVAGAVHASTVNGGIDATWAVAPGADAKLQTVNGDVELALPEKSGLEIGLETMNGELWSDFEVVAVPNRASPSRRGGTYRLDRDTVVRIGDGGPRFDCETLNGDIVVRAR